MPDYGVAIGYVVVFGAMIYFLFIRPQKKREKEAKEMVSKLVVGVKVVTIGGVVGNVVHVGDDEVTIETSVEKTQLVFLKSAIASIKDRPADVVLEAKTTESKGDSKVIENK